ncbi:hypothetical protein BDP27DRAFT_1419514 [Rhodocollybia butyracea]|uniref:Uncharacterized protein n=1 Tax=Rhodocollybia butyracea TaxID=206335 RepID=A0A9P5PRN8_9AGAR|nr:hypothetical protein BDP27DRAFT_1419514 [Rhodocollybia butyracea]
MLDNYRLDCQRRTKKFFNIQPHSDLLCQETSPSPKISDTETEIKSLENDKSNLTKLQCRKNELEKLKNILSPIRRVPLDVLSETSTQSTQRQRQPLPLPRGRSSGGTTHPSASTQTQPIHPYSVLGFSLMFRRRRSTGPLAVNNTAPAPASRHPLHLATPFSPTASPFRLRLRSH